MKDILAIDLGGTNVRLALASRDAGRWRLERVVRYPTATKTSLEDAVRAYLAETSAAPVACGVGVAGPVLGGAAEITNLPWRIEAAALESLLSCPVALLNDLEAHGLGAIASGPEAGRLLRRGVPRADGNAAMIAPGTGLGEAILFRAGDALVPRASEGGHASFAPIDDESLELLRFLMARHGHVSWERVVSGLDGFRNLFDFLVATRRIQVDAGLVEQWATRQDLGAAIFAAAAEGKPFAREVLHRFVRLFGAEAGNLALKALATSGLYIAGGMAAKLFEHVPFDVFAASFQAKGRFEELLARIPIILVEDPLVALVGAAARAVEGRA